MVLYTGILMARKWYVRSNNSTFGNETSTQYTIRGRSDVQKNSALAFEEI